MENIAFKNKLLKTIALVSKIPNAIIIGSEVPNLFYLSRNIQIDLFVSQDIDIGIPVHLLENIEPHISALEQFYKRSESEPSVLIPYTDENLEINFFGIDYDLSSLDEAYIYRSDSMSFMVFGNLSLIEPEKIKIGDMELNIAGPVSLIIEKLLSERNYIKIERDLIIAALLLDLIDIKRESPFIISKFNILDKERKLMIIDNLVFLVSLLTKTDYPHRFIQNTKDILLILSNELNI